MICLAISYILATAKPDLNCSQEKIEIVLVESNSSKEERLNREREEKDRIQLRREKPYVASNSEVTVLYPSDVNNCVQWAKSQTGISGTLGAGGRSAIQGQEPKVGAIGSTKGTAHAVVIVAINGDDIIINESNYRKGFITQRILHRSDFIGFIYG